MLNAAFTRRSDHQLNRRQTDSIKTMTSVFIVCSLLSHTCGRPLEAQYEHTESQLKHEKQLADAEEVLKKSDELLRKMKKEEADQKERIRAEKDRKRTNSFLIASGLSLTILMGKLLVNVINRDTKSSSRPD